MIVGEHTRGNDLEINVLKGKKLTNVRAAGKDESCSSHPAHTNDARTGAGLYCR